MRPFTARTTYDAPIEAVAAMMADRDFVEHKVAKSRPVSYEVDVETAPDGAFTVTTQRALTTDRLPSAVQSLIGRTVELRLVERWGAPAADGSRQGGIELQVIGKPVTASGSATMTPDGATTVLVYDGTVEAKVPLVGRKIEDQAVQQVQTVLELERQVGVAWLAEH